MLFFILAGGYGKRAQPLSLIKPKPLFPLDGTPLTRLTLKQLKKKGVEKGFINLHYKSRMMKENLPGDLQIEYLYEEKLSGSKILRQAAPYIDDFLLIVNGDISLDIPVTKMYKKIVAEACDGILLFRKSDSPGYPTVILEDGCYVRRKKNGGKGCLMYTGVALFKKPVLEKIDEINFFDTLDKSKFRIKPLMHRGIWLDIGSPRSYFEADSMYRKHIKSPGSNSLSKNVQISSDSKVKNSIIWENTTINNKSNISNCIITGDMALKNAHYSGKIITKEHVYDF
ncbi:sugar phosphate nucleotidyltransferase [Acidobacteriota bacterium]